MLAKTLKLLTVLLLVCICKTNAQIKAASAAAAPATLPFTREVDSIFQYLNKSYITTGVLYDRVFPFALLHVFNTTDADTSFRSHFLQGYYELYNAAYDNSIFTNPDMVDKRVAGIVKAGKVPIGIFNYQFNQMDTNALAHNLISSSSGLYYDVAGRPRSPYWLKQVSIISPLLDSVTGLQVAFQTAGNLFFQNTGRTISSLKADFGNGAGLLTISTNGVTIVNYTTYGTKIIRFVITYNDNTQRTTYGKIKVVQGVAGTTGITTTCDRLDSVYGAIPFTDYENNTYNGKGEIYYYFATNTVCNGKVRKPIIVLDGFDPQNKRSIDQLYKIYLNNDNRYKFADELRNNGFDIVVINFPVYTNSLGMEVDGGTEYIERNAFVLVELINKLKQELADNGSTAKIKIVGPSMGGLISRYALAYMEKNNLQHNTDLWISFDSPHNGANIPIGAQRFLEFFAGNGNKGAQEALDHQLDNPAAKQMLLHHFKSTSALAQGAPDFRDRFATALTSNGMTGSNGFPTLVRKVSIVNGSLNGALQPGVGACGKALDMTTNLTFKWMFLFKMKLFRVAKADIYFAGSYANNCKVFDGSQLFKGSRTDNGYSPASSVSYDIAPGGTFNVLKILADEAGDETFGFGWQLLLNTLLLKFGTYGTNTSFNTYTETHSFIPTKSALAWKATNTNQDLAENLYNRNLVCTNETPFDTYYGGLINLEHVYITPEIARFAIDEINGTPLQPTYQSTIPGLYLSGPTAFCPTGNYSLTGGTLPSGTSIVWNLSPQIASLSGQGTTQVQLSHITNGTATLNVQLTEVCGVNQTLSKIISISGPDAYQLSLESSGRPCAESYGQELSLGASYAGSNGCGLSSAGITEVQWQINSPYSYQLHSNAGAFYCSGITNSGIKVTFSRQTNPYMVTILMRAKNLCGQWSDWSPGFYHYVQNCGWYYSFSPNPATSDVTVAATTADGKEEKVITEVNIYDQQGNLKKRQQFAKVKKATLNISHLPHGIYFIEISDGKTKERQQLLIQK